MADAEIARRVALARHLAADNLDGPDPEWRSELAAEARDDVTAVPW